MYELRQMLEVETPLGWGHAILIEGANHDYLWTVVLAESLAIVTFKQNQLKVCRNYSNNWNFKDEEMLAIINNWIQSHAVPNRKGNSAQPKRQRQKKV